jgi:ribonuclease HI
LANFIEDCTQLASYTKGLVLESPWKLYSDRACGNAGAGASAILRSPSGIKLRYASRLQFTKETDKCTYNIVEYDAVLLGLRKLRVMGIHNCIIKMDSKVIVGHIEKECITRGITQENFQALVRRMENYFRGFSVKHIDRNNRNKVDELVKATTRKIALPPRCILSNN